MRLHDSSMRCKSNTSRRSRNGFVLRVSLQSTRIEDSPLGSQDPTMALLVALLLPKLIHPVVLQDLLLRRVCGLGQSRLVLPGARPRLHLEEANWWRMTTLRTT